MKARAVIGANYGDEGKGLVTDYLANQGGKVVVRFNGGCQAGHTVVTPEGQRHVFSHFGAGTFLGLGTFFSQHCIINPALLRKELLELEALGVKPRLHIAQECLVTTPWDMNENQDRERRMGNNRHGSCGVGIFDTIKRDQMKPLRFRDIIGKSYLDKMESIADYYGIRDGREATINRFLIDASFVANFAYAAEMQQFGSGVIFEGAQGLLLSQDNVRWMPHLSPSYCGMRNVRELMWQAGIDDVEAYYVTRSYVTRHGAGPLKDEYKGMGYEDNTNVKNEWQGPLRQAPVAYGEVYKRIHTDHPNPKLIITHCDQRAATGVPAYLKFYGPTRNDVEIPLKQSA